MIRLGQRNYLCLQGTCLINKAFFNVSSNPNKTLLRQPNLVRRFASKQKEEEQLERIYYGPLTPQIRAVKIFSVSSSAAGLAAQPIILREASSIGSTSLIIALCSVVGFFTFVTPLLLHIITKKYVTEMHYDPKTETYRATTINFFIAPVHVHLIFIGVSLKKFSLTIMLKLLWISFHYIGNEVQLYLLYHQHHFKAEDVVVPDIPGMFTTLIAKGRPLFVEARHFSDPLYYAKIMGYDKPLDFKLGDPQDNENKSS